MLGLTTVVNQLWNFFTQNKSIGKSGVLRKGQVDILYRWEVR